MNAFKLLFPIETASRELLYKLVLAARFAALGYECFIGSKQQINRIIDVIDPVVYFDKGYHPNVSEDIYRIVKRHDGVIVSLDEEGGVDFGDCSTLLSRYPNDIFKWCDQIFFWGKTQHDLIKSNCDKFLENKAIISGHPRFDLLKQSYHYLYRSDVEKIKQKYGDYILINTNMGFGNNIRGDEFVRKNYGGRVKDLETIISYDKIKLRNYIRLARQLAASLGMNFILRPHPEEDHSCYRDAFNNLDNVSVIYEGSAVPWILGAEVMIHPDCTTGIESYMMGKKPISYLPVSEYRHTTHVPVEVSYKFSNNDEVLRFILKKGYVSSENDDAGHLLHDFFAFEMDSQHIIVDAINQMLEEMPENASIKRLPGGYALSSTVREILASVYRYWAVNGQTALAKNKLRGFDIKSVKSTFSRIVSGLDGVSRVELKVINSRLFSIRVYI
jgi:surface carbohydrate biosynthesis protein